MTDDEEALALLERFVSAFEDVGKAAIRIATVVMQAERRHVREHADYLAELAAEKAEEVEDD